jgi:DNA gyrase/topoisomerase IV subunit B
MTKTNKKKLTDEELLEEIKWCKTMINLFQEDSEFSSNTKKRLIDEALDRLNQLIQEKNIRGLK